MAVHIMSSRLRLTVGKLKVWLPEEEGEGELQGIGTSHMGPEEEL